MLVSGWSGNRDTSGRSVREWRSSRCQERQHITGRPSCTRGSVSHLNFPSNLWTEWTLSDIYTCGRVAVVMNISLQLPVPGVTLQPGVMCRASTVLTHHHNVSWWNLPSPVLTPNIYISFSGHLPVYSGHLAVYIGHLAVYSGHLAV